MNCTNCGAELEEDARFCVICGKHVADAEPAPEPTPAPVPVEAEPVPAAEQPAAPAGHKKIDPAKLIGLAVGSLLILVGLIRISTAGTSVSNASFGGDFYTYTYRGIVAVTEQLASIEVSLGWIITAIGAAIDVSVLRK